VVLVRSLEASAASTPPASTPPASAPPASSLSSAVVWHDLECGSYRADLPLWLALARSRPDGAVLDVGAGTGRVALELARAGRRVIALDHDERLLAALRERAAGLDIDTVCADARSFQLPAAEPLALCLAPMQTVQLLGGHDGRLAFLRRARAHLLPGGLLACALVAEVEPFDRADGGPAPLPETAVRDGLRYSSQPTRLALGRRTIAIERERRIGESAAFERDLVELDRIDPQDLEREGAAVGLHPEPARHVPATDDHAGSAVAVLRA
jgi:SAM-dependent methyltransferase